jgi:hypothetical protein
MVAGKFFPVRNGNGIYRVMLKVGHPPCGPYQRRTASHGRVCNLRAVLAGAELDVLAHLNLAAIKEPSIYSCCDGIGR